MCHPVKEESDEIPLLSYNNGSRFLTVDFQPEKICMMPSTGRIYHPGPEKTGGIGLLGDKLGILWTAVRNTQVLTFFFRDMYIRGVSEVQFCTTERPQLFEFEVAICRTCI